MRFIKVHISDIQKAAKSRPPGYLAEVMAAGTLMDRFLVFPAGVYDALRTKYSPGQGVRIRGVDGQVHATPDAPLPEPSALDLTLNFSRAVARWTAAGFPTVSEEVYRQRAAACATCDFWDPDARLGLGKCKHPRCGCTKAKRWLATETCPDGRWPASPMQTPGNTPANPPPGPPPAPPSDQA